MSIPKQIIAAAVQATIIKRKIAALSKDLEAAKDIIRPYATEWYQEARKGSPEMTMVEIPTTEGTLSVIFPSDKPDVKKGQKLELLVAELPQKRSELVVVSELSLVKTFKESYLTEGFFSKSERRLIDKVIEWKEQTPRVEPAK
jgi:hypothetical protein